MNNRVPPLPFDFPPPGANLLPFLNQNTNNSIPRQSGLQLYGYCRTVSMHTSVGEPICEKSPKSFIKENGTDPLDYIYIFRKPANPATNSPQHWHYVGFGLSDIHDFRDVWEFDYKLRAIDPVRFANTPELPKPYLPWDRAQQVPHSEKVSGFGIELSFRVRCDPPSTLDCKPPTWPIRLMQAMAKYVFQSKNVFNPGDHAAWDRSLDGEESIIKHMLMTLDPELKETTTSQGRVKFIQLIGVCQDELQAAREWNVRGILQFMSEREETGGNLLVTDMRRGESIFELNPDYRNRIEHEIQRTGSDMASISAKHCYSGFKPQWFLEAQMSQSQRRSHGGEDDDEMSMRDENDSLMMNDERSQVVNNMSRVVTPSRDDCNMGVQDYSSIPRNPSRMSFVSESDLMVENVENVNDRFYDNMYLLLSSESAKVLSVVISARLARGRPFSFKTFKGDLCTMFVPEAAAYESLVSRDKPLVRRGCVLQIYVSNELREAMSVAFQEDFNPESESVALPKNYSWPEHRLHLTIVQEL